MKRETLHVHDVMSTALLTVRPGDSIERADLDMRLAGVRHFPVIDESNKLLGVVSDRDLLRAFGTSDKKTVRIRNVMTARVLTVKTDTPAHDAVELLMEEKIGCLPVIGERGQLVGLVTETDFLRVAYQALTASTRGLAR